MNSVFRGLKTWAGRPITFLMMEGGSTSTHQLRLSRGILAFVIISTMALLGSAFFVVTHHVNYFQQFLEMRRLRSQVSAYEREIHQVRQVQDHVASLDASLRELLGLKNKTAIVKASAIGGPSLKAQPPISLEDDQRQIEERVQQVSSVGKEESESFAEIEDRITELKSVYLATPLGKPIRGGWITSYYGQRGNPLMANEHEGHEWHAGVDIASGPGVPIYATADGRVSFAGYEKGYGLVVRIQHGFAYSTLYGHCSKLNVRTGDFVKRGQLVSLMGSTGNSTGPHVHYEVRYNNAPINPMKYIREEW